MESGNRDPPTSGCRRCRGHGASSGSPAPGAAMSGTSRPQVSEAESLPYRSRSVTAQTVSAAPVRAPAAAEGWPGERHEQRDEAAHVGRAFDVGDLLGIPGEEIGQVAVEEASARCLAVDRFGVAAARLGRDSSRGEGLRGRSAPRRRARRPRRRSRQAHRRSRPGTAARARWSSARPGSASGRLRNPSSRAEPVSRKRPGHGSRSTVA